MAPKWILVVDDDGSVRELWLEALRQAGYKALGCRDGAEALDMIRSLAPDLILLDLRMPRMAGEEFLEHLRHQGRFTRYVRVLLVSAYLGQIERLPTDVQVVGAIEKPITRSVLLKAVERVLAPPPSDRKARMADEAPPDAAATCAACSNRLEAAVSIPGPHGGAVHLPCWTRTLDAEGRDVADSASGSTDRPRHGGVPA